MSVESAIFLYSFRASRLRFAYCGSLVLWCRGYVSFVSILNVSQFCIYFVSQVTFTSIYMHHSLCMYQYLPLEWAKFSSRSDALFNIMILELSFYGNALGQVMLMCEAGYCYSAVRYLNNFMVPTGPENKLWSLGDRFRKLTDRRTTGNQRYSFNINSFTSVSKKVCERRK